MTSREKALWQCICNIHGVNSTDTNAWELLFQAVNRKHERASLVDDYAVANQRLRDLNSRLEAALAHLLPSSVKAALGELDTDQLERLC